MSSTTYLARFIIVAVALLGLGTGSASACGIMGGGVLMSVAEGGPGFGTLVQRDITVDAIDGEICFIATNLNSALSIDAIRFQGNDGGEFGTFVDDPDVAAKFGPGYRAWSATARTRVQMESFTLEIDYTAPSPSIELPRIGDAVAGTALALGQTDGSGSVEDHASIVQIIEVDLSFAP